ncbi:hypothetical protein P3L10_032648 [Capsicum annuum]
MSDGEMSVFKYRGQTKGASDEGNRLPHDEFNKTCNYVLENFEEISLYREEYIRQTEVEGSTRTHQVNKNRFINWFRARIFLLSSQGRTNNEIISLAVCPKPLVHRYSTCTVNGFRFQTKDHMRKTQNSGVLMRGDVSDSNKEYYGVLKDIYELRYTGNRKSEQVFYLNDLIDKDWLVVVKTNPRDLFNVPEVEREASLNNEVYQQDEVEDILCGNNQETKIEVSLHRDDVEAEIILRTNDQVNKENGFINHNDTDVLDNEESEEEFIDDNDGEDSDMSC